MVARLNTNVSNSSSDCIAALRCSAASGYLGVCRASKGASGEWIWRAYVKVNGRKVDLRCRSTDRTVCARAVAAWYAARYGAGWAQLVKSNRRRRNPWKVWYSERRGGWLARVWIRGKPVELVPLTRGYSPSLAALRRHWRLPFRPGVLPRPRRNAEPLVFATKAAARAAIWPWVRRQYPLTWRDAVWMAA